MTRLLLPTLGALVLLLAAAAVPASAMDEGRATLSVSPKRVDRGDAYTLRGRTWNVNSFCSRTVRFTSSRGTRLGSARVSAGGSFTVRKRVSRRSKKGFYAVTARQSCEGGAAVRTATIRIT